MAGDGGSGGGCNCKCKTTSSSSLRWPWLQLARCAASLVVAVLAAVILIKAVSLILHPNKFQLKVSGRFLVERYNSSLFVCRFYLQAENRRDRGFMYYRDVTVKLIGGGGGDHGAAATTSTTIMELNLSSVITLMQGQVQEYYLLVPYRHPLHETYVQALFSNDQQAQKIDGSTVELDGSLTNGGETYRASYSCAPVTIVRGNDITSLLPSPSGNDAAHCIPNVFQ